MGTVGMDSLRLRLRWRQYLVVIFAVIAAMHGTAEGSELGSALVEELRPEGAEMAFRVIAGFAMRSGATVLPNKSKPACENACLQEKECRSFSYRLKDKTCIWSTSSLTFDPDFMFASKTSQSENRMYRNFAGMSYRTQGWTIISGKDQGGCEAMCTNAKGCKAYSFRKRDKLCLLGPKGIVYSQDFNYYERRGLSYTPFPMLPPGAKFSCKGSLCGGPPPPPPVENPTENPAVKAMEGAEKARMKVAARDL